MKNIIYIVFFFCSNIIFGQVHYNNEYTKRFEADLIIVLTNNSDSIEKILDSYFMSSILSTCKVVEVYCDKSISEIPSSFYKMTWIESLSLIGNEGRNNALNEVVDKKFNSFSNLKKLKIEGLSISGFSKGVFLPNLKDLELRYTKIQKIPEGILHSKLERLIINDAPLGFIPSSIQKANNLSEVSFFNTSIDKLPPEFYNLSKITCLNLEATDIVSISDKIIAFKELEYLNLMTAGIMENVPNCLCSLPKLKQVSIIYTGDSELCFDNDDNWQKDGIDYYRKK